MLFAISLFLGSLASANAGAIATDLDTRCKMNADALNDKIADAKAKLANLKDSTESQTSEQSQVDAFRKDMMQDLDADSRGEAVDGQDEDDEANKAEREADKVWVSKPKSEILRQFKNEKDAASKSEGTSVMNLLEDQKEMTAEDIIKSAPKKKQLVAVATSAKVSAVSQEELTEEADFKKDMVDDLKEEAEGKTADENDHDAEEVASDKAEDGAEEWISKQANATDDIMKEFDAEEAEDIKKSAPKMALVQIAKQNATADGTSEQSEEAAFKKDVVDDLTEEASGETADEWDHDMEEEKSDEAEDAAEKWVSKDANAKSDVMKEFNDEELTSAEQNTQEAEKAEPNTPLTNDEKAARTKEVNEEKKEKTNGLALIQAQGELDKHLQSLEDLKAECADGDKKNGQKFLGA